MVAFGGHLFSDMEKSGFDKSVIGRCEEPILARLWSGELVC